MAIETNQIHNIVRTYQRTLHEGKSASHQPDAASRHEDRVSVSAEARERHAHKTETKAHTPQGKTRKS